MHEISIAGEPLPLPLLLINSSSLATTTDPATTAPASLMERFLWSWLPEPLQSRWTWTAVLLAFLLGAFLVWWMHRNIRIRGAIAIAFAFLSIPAFRLVIEQFGVEAEMLEQGWEAMVVACCIGGGLLVLEAQFQHYANRSQKSVDGLQIALNELLPLMRGKSPTERRTVIEGLVAMSSTPETAEDEAAFTATLDEINSDSIAAVRKQLQEEKARGATPKS